MQTYTAKLKTRKQMDLEIPRERQGWWRDCCPGKTLPNLRENVEPTKHRATLVLKKAADHAVETVLLRKL